MPLSHWLRFLCELQHRLLVVQSRPLQQQHLDGTIPATSRPRGWRDMAHCCYFFHYHTYSRYSPGGPFHGEILNNQDNRMTNNLYSSSTNGTGKKTLQFYVGTAVQIQGAVQSLMHAQPRMEMQEAQVELSALPQPCKAITARHSDAPHLPLSLQNLGSNTSSAGVGMADVYPPGRVTRTTNTLGWGQTVQYFFHFRSGTSNVEKDTWEHLLYYPSATKVSVWQCFYFQSTCNSKNS